MTRHSPLERFFLIASFSVIGFIAAFGVFQALIRQESREPTATPTPIATGGLGSGAPSPSPLPTPPPKPPPRISLRGQLVDWPGFSIPPGILGHTRVALLRD